MSDYKIEHVSRTANPLHPSPNYYPDYWAVCKLTQCFKCVVSGVPTRFSHVEIYYFLLSRLDIQKNRKKEDEKHIQITYGTHQVGSFCKKKKVFENPPRRTKESNKKDGDGCRRKGEQERTSVDGTLNTWRKAFITNKRKLKNPREIEGFLSSSSCWFKSLSSMLLYVVGCGA